MSFSRAATRRFNESTSFTPSPAAYNVTPISLLTSSRHSRRAHRKRLTAKSDSTSSGNSTGGGVISTCSQACEGHATSEPVADPDVEQPVDRQEGQQASEMTEVAQVYVIAEPVMCTRQSHLEGEYASKTESSQGLTEASDLATNGPIAAMTAGIREHEPSDACSVEEPQASRAAAAAAAEQVSQAEVFDESAMLRLALEAELSASSAAIIALKEQLADARAAHKETQDALNDSENDNVRLRELLDEMRRDHASSIATSRAQMIKLQGLEKVLKSLNESRASGSENSIGAILQYSEMLQAENKQLKEDLHEAMLSQRCADEKIRGLRCELSGASNAKLDLEEKLRGLLQDNLSLTGQVASTVKECESLEHTVDMLRCQLQSTLRADDVKSTRLREAEEALREVLTRDTQDSDALQRALQDCAELRQQLSVGTVELSNARANLADHEAAIVALQEALSTTESSLRHALQSAEADSTLAKAEASHTREQLSLAEEALASQRKQCSRLAAIEETLSRKCDELESQASGWADACTQLRQAEDACVKLKVDLESSMAATALATADASAVREELLAVRTKADSALASAKLETERAAKATARVEQLLIVNCQLSDKLVAQSALYRQIEELQALAEKVRAESDARLAAACADKDDLMEQLDKVKKECAATCEQVRSTSSCEQERLRMQAEEYCRRIVDLQTKLAACNAELLRIRPDVGKSASDEATSRAAVLQPSDQEISTHTYSPAFFADGPSRQDNDIVHAVKYTLSSCSASAQRPSLSSQSRAHEVHQQSKGYSLGRCDENDHGTQEVDTLNASQHRRNQRPFTAKSDYRLMPQYSSGRLDMQRSLTTMPLRDATNVRNHRTSS